MIGLLTRDDHWKWTLKWPQGFTMFWGFWDNLRIFIKLAHQPTLPDNFWFRSFFFSRWRRADLSFAVRNNDFLSLSKFGAHRNIKPLRFSSFTGNSTAVFSCKLVWLEKLFHNFGYATPKDLSLTPEKDLPLKNTSMLPGRFSLNLILWRGKAK